MDLLFGKFEEGIAAGAAQGDRLLLGVLRRMVESDRQVSFVAVFKCRRRPGLRQRTSAFCSSRSNPKGISCWLIIGMLQGCCSDCVRPSCGAEHEWEMLEYAASTLHISTVDGACFTIGPADGPCAAAAVAPGAGRFTGAARKGRPYQDLCRGAVPIRHWAAAAAPLGARVRLRFVDNTCGCLLPNSSPKPA